MFHPCFCSNQGAEGEPDLCLMALQSALILATLASLIDENLGATFDCCCCCCCCGGGGGGGGRGHGLGSR